MNLEDQFPTSETVTLPIERAEVQPPIDTMGFPAQLLDKPNFLLWRKKKGSASFAMAHHDGKDWVWSAKWKERSKHTLREVLEALKWFRDQVAQGAPGHDGMLYNLAFFPEGTNCTVIDFDFKAYARHEAEAAGNPDKLARLAKGKQLMVDWKNELCGYTYVEQSKTPGSYHALVWLPDYGRSIGATLPEDADDDARDATKLPMDLLGGGLIVLTGDQVSEGNLIHGPTPDDKEYIESLWHKKSGQIANDGCLFFNGRQVMVDHERMRFRSVSPDTGELFRCYTSADKLREAVVALNPRYGWHLNGGDAPGDLKGATEERLDFIQALFAAGGTFTAWNALEVVEEVLFSSSFATDYTPNHATNKDRFTNPAHINRILSREIPLGAGLAYEAEQIATLGVDVATLAAWSIEEREAKYADAKAAQQDFAANKLVALHDGMTAKKQAMQVANFEAVTARPEEALSDAPNEIDLKPIPLPDLPPVNELRAAIAASTDDPTICDHAINYATFIAWTNVMTPIINCDGDSAMAPTLAVGLPGSSKTQSANPLRKMLDPARLSKIGGLKSPTTFFRIYDEVKSAEGLRDAPRSHRFTLFMKNDADPYLKGLDQEKATAKFAGLSDTFITHFDGNIKVTAKGAGTDDDTYTVLERARVGHAWNIQPGILAPLLTESVLSKGVTSRLNLIYLPKVAEDDDGNAVRFRSSRFKVPTWVDAVMVRYSERPGVAMANFVDESNARQIYARASKELQVSFPPSLHGALAHMRETVYRLAALYDGTALLSASEPTLSGGAFAFELDAEGRPPASDEDVIERALSDEAVEYAVAFVRESYRVMHYLDGAFGLGLLNDISAIRHGWKGILQHVRYQKKIKVPTLQVSKCVDLSRHSNRQTLLMLLDEVCDERFGAGRKEKHHYRIIDFDRMIELARTFLLDAGGVDESYAKQGKSASE